MRKLKRAIARRNMIKAGLTQINKRPLVRNATGMLVKADSKFAKHWREFIEE